MRKGHSRGTARAASPEPAITRRAKRSVAFLALAATLALVAASCSKKVTTNTPPPAVSTTPSATASTTPAASRTPAAAAATVRATDQRTFVPATVTIKVGQTVTWTNDGSIPHSVTFDNGAPFDESLDAGATVSRTFTTAGTFAYHCTIHGASMSGTVVVT